VAIRCHRVTPRPRPDLSDGLGPFAASRKATSDARHQASWLGADRGCSGLAHLRKPSELQVRSPASRIYCQ